MKVNVEVIIKDIFLVGRFLCPDTLLLAFCLVKMHIFPVQICLKILSISFSATIMCISNRKRIDVANDSFFISRGDIIFYVYFAHHFL